MLNATRWMIRHREATDDNETKQPESVHETKPDGYVGDGWTRTRWAQSVQWVDYDTANDYRLSNPGVDHLCFVLRDLEPGEKVRFICFDFDGCFDELGQLDPDVEGFVDEINTFAERSKNGLGLHVIAEYHGPPFKTKNGVEFGSCKVDVITSGQIVATGDVFDGYDTMRRLDHRDIRSRFGLVEKNVDGRHVGDCWATDFDKVPLDKRYLGGDMVDWEPCIEGQGGDKEFFKAACHLARHGITGEAARDLLTHVQARPAFNEQETTHKIESAFVRVHDDGEFDAFAHGRRSAKSEFGAVEQPEAELEAEAPEAYAGVDPLPTPDGMNDAEIAFFKSTGFEGLELSRHFEIFSPENMPNFIIRDLMFETGALMIGGQNKTFKTTIGLDLVVSLATGQPFLNEFEIECSTKKVAIFSSETQEHLMTQYLGTVLTSKGLTPGDFRKSFTINSTVPPFIQDNGRMKRNPRFERYLQDKKPEVVLFDPLYRMFLGVNQADISSMGQALEYVEMTCMRFGAMPIFCHHSRKPNTMNGSEFPVMTLNDLSGAGGGAFCRQWLLLSHTRRYVNGSGRLHVCIGASGADEHQWIINIETYDDERNRVWKPKAFKLNMTEEIIHRLQTDGPLSIRQLSARLKASEYDIEQVCDQLESNGRVDQLSNKVSLASQQSGEFDV